MSKKDVDFDQLVKDILQDPEKVLNKADIDNETLLELQKRLNPYGTAFETSGDSEQVRAVAISQSYIRETYMRRFIMTSLVGFVYRLLDEVTIDPADRRWTSKNKRGGDESNVLKSSRDILDPDTMVQRAEELLRVAKLAKESCDKNEALKRVVIEKELYSEEELVNPMESRQRKEELRKSDEEYQENLALSWAMRYTFIRNAFFMGQEADAHFDEVADEAIAFPKVAPKVKDDKVNRGRIPVNQFEVPEKLVKSIFKNFINNWFEFNPDEHVKSAYNFDEVKEAIRTQMKGDHLAIYDAADPLRLPIEVLVSKRPEVDPYIQSEAEKVAVRTILSSQRAYNTACHLMREPELADAISVILKDRERFAPVVFPLREESEIRKVLEKIPPQDTFNRWEYYTTVNYEELRTASESLYPEKAGIEDGIVVYDYFKGSQGDCDKWFDELCDRIQDTVITDVQKIEFGKWHLTAPFKPNRDGVSFFNRETTAVKRILDRVELDRKLGKDMMLKNVYKKKAKNIREDGADDPKLNEYKKEMADQISKLGVKAAIGTKQKQYLERAKGNVSLAKEIEYMADIEERIGVLEKKLLKNGSLQRADDVELKRLRKDHEKALEMIKVPADAIQVDIFSHDSRTGDFTKTKLYTEAEAPVHMSSDGKGKGRTSDDSRSEKDEPPQLAPFALELLEEERRVERERLALISEAVREKAERESRDANA